MEDKEEKKKDDEEESENGGIEPHEEDKKKEEDDIPDNAHDIAEHQAEEEGKDADKYEKLAKVWEDKYHDPAAAEAYRMIAKEERTHQSISEGLMNKYDEKSEKNEEERSKAFGLMGIKKDEDED